MREPVTDSPGVSPSLRENIRHLYGLHPHSVEWGPNELVVMCLVRNGMSYLGEFLDHYDSLGARHLVFLDNGSTDGTLEALEVAAKSRGISVFSTELPYAEHRHEFKRYMLDAYGTKDRWVLMVDIDEFFDYPRSRSVDLGGFLTRLSESRYTAVVAQMLDMFPEEPLTKDSTPVQEKKLRESHRFYDISEVKTADYADHPWVTDNAVSNDDIMAFRGGIRRQVFGVTPTLTKHPLMFLDGRIRPLEDSAHWSNGAKIADVSCVLYHYKFLRGFHDFVERAASGESYADASSEYKGYLGVLRKTPELSLRRGSDTELRGTDQLVSSGFLVVSDEYASWADGLELSRIQSLAKEAPQELVREYMEVRREANLGGRTVIGIARERHEIGLETIRLRQNLSDRTERVKQLRAEIEAIESSRVWRTAAAVRTFLDRLPGRHGKDAS